jgi:hypothetical protein
MVPAQKLTANKNTLADALFGGVPSLAEQLFQAPAAIAV